MSFFSHKEKEDKNKKLQQELPKEQKESGMNEKDKDVKLMLTGMDAYAEAKLQQGKNVTRFVKQCIIL